MGKTKKIEFIKESFLRTCQQYERLGLYLRAEAEALKKCDIQGAAYARQCLHMQFREAGEQLKVLGESVDRLGGVSVYRSRGGNDA